VECALAARHGYTGNDLRVVLGDDVVMAFTGIVIDACGVLDLERTKDSQVIETTWGHRMRRRGPYVWFEHYPLENAESVRDIARYRPPDPSAPENYADLSEMIEKYGDTHAVVAVMAGWLFEGGRFLRGMEQWCIDLVSNKEIAHAVCDLLLDWHTVVGRRCIEIGCDIILEGDDIAGQQGLLISPEIYREFFKPRKSKVFSDWKQRKPDLIIANHVCGAPQALIQDFIEQGMDTLQGLQSSAKGMYGDGLKRRYGDKISFWGGIDVQQVLSLGTLEEVEVHVKDRIAVYGQGGGYMLGVSNMIQPDTSLEKIELLYSVTKQYGTYPLAF